MRDERSVKRAILTEDGASAEVNGSTSIYGSWSRDEPPVIAPSDFLLPNGHVTEVRGSASHEAGAINQSRGHFPGSSTVNEGSTPKDPVDRP